MVKYKLFRNHLGMVSVILIDNVRFSLQSLQGLIDVFSPEFILTKIVALDRNDSFFKNISEAQFNILFPENDTITSEVIITSKVNDIVLVFETLLNSEPRCISLYGIDTHNDMHIEAFSGDDELLIQKGVVDYSISFIVEESCIKIVFNSNIYNPKQLFRLIKNNFCKIKT